MLANTIGASFVETNTVNTLQGFDESNDCDETGDGNNDAICNNDVDNLHWASRPIKFRNRYYP